MTGGGGAACVAGTLSTDFSCAFLAVALLAVVLFAVVFLAVGLFGWFFGGGGVGVWGGVFVGKDFLRGLLDRNAFLPCPASGRGHRAGRSVQFGGGCHKEPLGLTCWGKRN